jgi:hypothetical protein
VTGEQRMVCRIAAAGEYCPAASRRFNDLVAVRRSWSLYFLARSVGLLKPRMFTR